jgi:hypothetical protein
MLSLDQARRYSLSLPDTAEAPHFNFSSFRVRGKIFVTIPPSDEFIHIFVPSAEIQPALDAHPDFLEELWWGKKVVGLRANLSTANPAVIKDLIHSAWTGKAPKSKPAAKATLSRKKR